MTFHFPQPRMGRARILNNLNPTIMVPKVHHSIHLQGRQRCSNNWFVFNKILTSCITSSCRIRQRLLSPFGSFTDIARTTSLNAWVCSASRLRSFKSSASDSNCVSANCSDMRSSCPCPVWWSKSCEQTSNKINYRNQIIISVISLCLFLWLVTGSRNFFTN